MTQAVIQAQGLGKRYRLGESGYSTLRDKLGSGRSSRRERSVAQEIWALRELDLEVAQGDVVGIVGRNGAGKTTFLKTVARIVRPSTGVVRVRGRVGALLEVGTGFHPELTGRENVFLNGVVLGMSRAEIRRRFDDIVEFAGVERFLDTPLKRYSSGMNLRLAFAVAAHIDPDVIIVDEVLAVGDAEFQRRCLGRMSEFGQEGRTVLFVSHDSGAVGRLCKRAIWLENGRVRDDGPAHDVLRRYLDTMVVNAPQVSVPGRPQTPISHVSIAIQDGSGAPLATPRRDDPLSFRLQFATTDRLLGLDIAVYLLDANGVMVLSENISDQQGKVGGRPQEFNVRLTVPPALAPGDYTVGVWLGTESESLFYEELLTFTLMPGPADREEALRRKRIVQLPVVWEVETKPTTGGQDD